MWWRSWENNPTDIIPHHEFTYKEQALMGIILALISAASWGTGDFLGGLASRKMHQFQVLLFSTSSSMLLVFLCAFLWGEHFPSVHNIILAVLAGVCGAGGLAALYKGLSMGNAALVAPVAGVVGALIPTFVGILIEGLPGGLQLFGFALSIAGIWIVSRSHDGNASGSRDGLSMALLAGLGFGGFLAFIAQVQGEQVFAPLVFSKLASVSFAFVLLRTRQLPIPKLKASPIAILSGFLDAGGNIFYLFATQFTRLDIAAVLSSLYPAGTVLLSSIFLKEKLTVYQWIGVGVCLAAIMLITSG
jgi:drug/metabolite transporter (DMT)-like permease